MNGHLRTLKLVQLLPNGCLVLGCQPCPGFIGPSVVVVGLRDFDVIVEPDNLFQRYSNIISFSGFIPSCVPFHEQNWWENTFFSLSSSTVGRKLSFRSRYRFFSSFCFFSSAGLCSANRLRTLYSIHWSYLAIFYPQQRRIDAFYLQTRQLQRSDRILLTF